MTAFDTEVIDALGKIERRVALDAEIEESVEPLAAGIEMEQRPFVPALADGGVPRTHARALKARSKNHVVVAEALDVCRRQRRAAPVQIIQRSPGFAVPILGFLLFDIVLLQGFAPAPARFGQFRFVSITWPPGAVDDDRFQFFRTQDRAAAVRGKMIVVVGEHGRAIQIFTGGSDAKNFCLRTFHRVTQTIFRSSGTKPPKIRSIAQLGSAFVNIKIDRLWRCACEYNAVVPGGLEIGSPIAAGGAASQSRARERTQIDGGHLRAARRKTVSG